jgi:cyclic-di-GMP phosphodiesterase TipF (flagellum assembly factor)
VPAASPRRQVDDESLEDENIDNAAAADDPRAQDIAMMQSLIKGLAEQLNGPGAPAARAAVTSPSADAHTGDEGLDTIDQQVDALREAARTMHHPDGHSEVAAPPKHDQGALARIAGAVDAARIDVYLDPILGLDDHRARHYEVSVVLRDESGERIDPRDYARAIANTGLMPRVDSIAVREATRFAGQIAARGSNASLFSSLSGESIRDGGFHGALIEALTPDTTLATRLVMAVSQSEIRTFGPAHWDALAAMAESGLRYALVDVVDLDVDFEGLKSHGFDFVRLDAQVFLDGLQAPHGVVPSADICRYLSQLGFSLIVGRITDERELVKVFGFGALLGQGTLFGSSRPIKIDRGAARTSAA